MLGIVYHNSCHIRLLLARYLNYLPLGGGDRRSKCGSYICGLRHFMGNNGNREKLNFHAVFSLKARV